MKTPEDVPVFDRSRLEDIFEDDTAAIADLLEMALEAGAKNLAALADAVARHELDDVMRAAHAIMGSSDNIGGYEVAVIARRIEASARTKQWIGIEPAVGELHVACDRLRSELRAYRSELS